MAPRLLRPPTSAPSLFAFLPAGIGLFVAFSVSCSTDEVAGEGSTGEAQSSTTGCGPEVPAPLGGYCVSGNQVLDETGTPKTFHGVNRPSLEWSIQGENLSPEDFEKMTAWSADTVRLPLNQSYWLGIRAEDYQARVAEVVGWARAAGLHVILDLHRAPLPGGEENEQQDMTNEGSLVFWEQVATAYKNEPDISFELYNEPRNITWNEWRDGGTHSDGWTIVGMQQLYDTVRSTGAHNLVLIGGLNWAYDLSGIVDYPVAGYNIVYVTHLYGYGGKQPEDWQDDWLFLSDQYPLFVSEFGPHLTDPEEADLTYTAAVMDTADAHGLSWTAWAWFDFSTNNLFEAPWASDPTDYEVSVYGEQVRDRLRSD